MWIIIKKKIKVCVKEDFCTEVMIFWAEILNVSQNRLACSVCDQQRLPIFFSLPRGPDSTTTTHAVPFSCLPLSLFLRLKVWPHPIHALLIIP